MKTITLQVDESERLALVAALKAYQRSCATASASLSAAGCVTSPPFLLSEAITARRLARQFEVAR